MNALAKLQEGHRLLAEARTVQDVKRFHDLAIAAQYYAKAQHLGLEAQNYAGEFVVRAARKLGSMLPMTVRRGGDKKSKSKSSTLISLKQLGLTKNQSADAQHVAQIPTPLFEEFIAGANGNGVPLTVHGILEGTKRRPDAGYWLIPPDIYTRYKTEMQFDYDPCPWPRPDGYDGLVADWGSSSWVNPPFWAGITAWAKKALEEHAKGKSVTLILPVDNWIRLLLDAGAEVRSEGFHDWIHSTTKTKRKAPRPSLVFILRGKPS